MAGESEGQLSVLLVDGHQLFRDGLRDLLDGHGFAVAGAAATAADAVALAAEARPDVALIEIGLPDRSGIEAARALRLVSPATQVVMLTVSPDESDVVEAIHAGACGYLLKDSSLDDIASSVRAAAAGASPLSPRIAVHLLAWLRDGREPRQPADGRAPKLTARELEVLRLVTAGKRNGQIARELVISEQTVKSHVSSVLSKLGVANRIQAAVHAVRARLV